MNKPDTQPGFCPVCSKPANIWDEKDAHWHCVQCNWSGRFPAVKPWINVGDERGRF